MEFDVTDLLVDNVEEDIASDDQFIYDCESLERPVPPDIILKLCREGSVDIADIFISDITEKYIEYVSQMEETDYEYMSGFLVYASKLLEYKSSLLLPIAEYDDYQEEDDYNMDGDLIQMKLEEYKMLTEVAEKLGKLEQLDRVYRRPMFGKKDIDVQLKNFDMDKMVSTFKLLMEKRELVEDKAEPKTIKKERFTVSERINELVESVRAFKKLRFYDLLRADFGKVEVINTFLALLEMLKQQIIKVEQTEDSSDILIIHAEETDTYGLEQQEELFKDVKEYD